MISKILIFLSGVLIGVLAVVVFILFQPKPPDLQKKIDNIKQRHQAERELAERNFAELEGMLKAEGEKIDRLNTEIDGYTSEIARLKKQASKPDTSAKEQLELCLEREGLHEKKEISLREIIDSQGIQLIKTHHFGTEYYNRYLSKDWDLQQAEIRIAELERQKFTIITISVIGGIATGIVVRSMFR